MMPIAETRTFQIGAYTVHQRPRPDNAFWPCYIVTRKGKIVGRSFSMPDLDCCKWLDLHRSGTYATPEESAPLKNWAKPHSVKRGHIRTGRK